MVELQLLAAWLVSALAPALGGLVPCNTTVELGPGAGARLERPVGGQGAALTCWYTLKLAQSMQGGLLSIHVDRFSVGRLEGGSCVGGHLRIEDGDPAVPAQGLHCGETELPKRLVRQAAQVTLTFQVEKVDRTVEWAMDVAALRKAEVPERFGKMPELFPGKVGAVVQETYCETVFQDCRVQQCNVQSPGFPGVYPRGLACRYYISTAASLIRLYVDRPYWQAFNVDGWRCESLRDCPARELSTGEKNCPWDWIKLYDGVDEYSPLIGHFCGTGSFPVSIIGTGNKLFLEFVTSEAGPLLNTGFDFRVTSVPGSGPSTNGSCHQVVSSSDLTGDEGSFISLEHWYSPGRNCSYLLSGEPTQRVRLHFEKMKMTQKTPIRQDLNDDCSEYLVLYDSSWPDPRAVLKAFCNGFSPPSENIDFLSTGSSLLVSFISLSGSYSGSSIYYWAIYSFHDARPDGEPVAGSLCDERISRAGQFRSPRNSLVFRAGGPLVCTYFLSAMGQQFARLELTLGPVDFSRGQEGCSRGCQGNGALDRLEVEEVGEKGNTSLACLSSCVAPHSTTVISQGSSLQLSLKLGSATPASSYYGRKAPLFTALLRFLHPPVCGPTSLSGQEPGSLEFPVLGQGQGGRYREVTCVWSLSLREGRQVGLTVSNVTLTTEDCGQHSLTIGRGEGQGQVLHRECGQSRGQGAEVEVPAAGPPSLTITLHMANLGLGGISLAWKYT